jgi:hypothetical protein
MHGRVYGRCRMGRGTMGWNLKWRFWQREAAAELVEKKFRWLQREPRSVEEWQARLAEQGVSAEPAAQIAEQLGPAYAELGRGSAAGLVVGATLAVEVQATESADVERSMRDVREVERLLSAFTGELEKLDEVLEVLAAYAQRMRNSPTKPDRPDPSAGAIKSSRRTLH